MQNLVGLSLQVNQPNYQKFVLDLRHLILWRIFKNFSIINKTLFIKNSSLKIFWLIFETD